MTGDDLLRSPLLVPVVAAATGRPDLTSSDLVTLRTSPLEHRIDNMTTAALSRVEATLADGTSCAVVAKVLQPALASPLAAYIPEDHHADVMRNLNWLDEPTVYRSPLSSDLPTGLSMPRVLGIEDGEERIVLWLELIDAAPSWDLEDYRRAARALGALAGRWPETRVIEQLGLGRRNLAYLFFGKLANVDLPVLASDEHWTDPVVARHVDPGFRDALDRLVEQAPMRIAAAEELPHAMSHGDATPDNLLRCGDGLTAIDWSYGSSGPLGADLGQLLAGRFDTGQLGPEEAPGVASVLLDAYLTGLADEDQHPDPKDVLAGWATHLGVRSAISSTVIDHRPDLDEEARAELLERRVAVARVALDLWFQSS